MHFGITELRIMAELSERFGESSPYDELSHIVYDSFNKRFWNEEKGCLFDVVDVDLGDGSKINDKAIRPNNQTWAKTVISVSSLTAMRRIIWGLCGLSRWALLLRLIAK